MATPKKLNKALWNNLTRLKLLYNKNAPDKFILEKSPFDEEEGNGQNKEEKSEYVIVGRIYPTSEIYKEGALRIEMKITSRYPTEPPEVRFLTPMYHPNISPDGTFCHQLLNNHSRWKIGTTLVDVLKSLVKHVDEPDPDYAVNYEIGKEYTDRKDEFNRKAREMIQKHALPRE